MAYAEQKYYVSGYLLGRSPAVPEAVFPYWEKQAERIIDQYTFDRVKRDNDLVSDTVRDCACELAGTAVCGGQRVAADIAAGRCWSVGVIQ